MGYFGLLWVISGFGTESDLSLVSCLQASTDLSLITILVIAVLVSCKSCHFSCKS